MTTTPIYGLRLLDAGSPIRLTRSVLNDNAQTIEAALARGAVAPPEAQDLVALAGRVADLERTAANKPWARGVFARTDATANLNPNSVTDLTMRSGSPSLSGSLDWQTADAGYQGYRTTAPGRYLIRAWLPTSNGNQRWESLKAVVNGAQVDVDDDNPGGGFSGLSGALVVDAPAGLTVGFRYQTNSTVAGTIRAGSSWSVHRIGVV